MPALTIYLSRLIGVVALIVAAAMLADKATVVTAVEHLGQDRTALLLLGFFPGRSAAAASCSRTMCGRKGCGHSSSR